MVEDYAIIGGMTPVHQHVRIGCHAMVGGMSRVTQDIPPYTIGGGAPYRLGGINRVGLKRRQFSFAARRALAQAFRLLYRSSLSLDEALRRIEKEVEALPEIIHLISFCKASKRGLIGMQGIRNQRAPKVEESDDLLMEFAG